MRRTRHGGSGSHSYVHGLAEVVQEVGMRSRTVAGSHTRRTLHTASVMAAVFATVTPLAAHGQPGTDAQPPLPFAVGERLVYRVRLSALGSVGTSAMWIEGPVDVRGVPTLLLRSSFEARKGFIHASGTSESWY